MPIQKHLLTEASYSPSPNVGGKLSEPKLIVVHYTAGRSAPSSVRWLCDPAAKASAHFVIGRDGAVHQLVKLDKVAWHAGQSQWKTWAALNSRSFGIELDNLGFLHRVNGRWRSLSTGIDVPDADVLEAPHKSGGPARGWQLYSSAQLGVLEDVCRQLIKAYPSIEDVVGHDDVAPGRKLDPGPAIDLDSLRSKLFGRQ